MRVISLFGTVLVWLWCTPALMAQEEFREDKRADKIMETGLQAYKDQHYTQAASVFELLLERKPNQHTVAATYMAAMCYYNLNDYDNAIRHFQKLLVGYPGNPYEEDAKYHKSLLMLDKADKRSGGLFLLLNLAEEAADTRLRTLADHQARQFFFYEADLAFLEDYYKIVRPSWKNIVTEAICLKLYRRDKVDALKRYLEEYQSRNQGQLSPALQKLAARPKLAETNLRIALVLPFNIGEKDTVLHPEDSWAFDLLAGMQLAASRMEAPFFSEIEVRVFDSRNQVARVEDLLKKEIGPWQPHLIIGDILNAPTKVIADFAEANHILQIVPLAPSESLIADKQQVFLANPTFAWQAQALALFVNKQVKPAKVLILKHPSTRAVFLESFTERLDPAIKVQVVGTETHNPEAFSRLVSSAGATCVFMPVDHEKVVQEYALQLREDARSPLLLGVPDWNLFNKLNKRLLSGFAAVYPSCYAPRADSLQYQALRGKCISTYKNPPTIYVFQGYDLLRMVAQHLGSAAPYTDAAEVLRKAPPFKGANQTYFFDTRQSNQQVQLLRLAGGKITRLQW
ncbi:MAG: tetratricopeptide repeat protein [Bacteroidetes bacterium]|nr:tetratricopeptide repeat protein [Bacteroidota bacterium]